MKYLAKYSAMVGLGALLCALCSCCGLEERAVGSAVPEHDAMDADPTLEELSKELAVLVEEDADRAAGGGGVGGFDTVALLPEEPEPEPEPESEDWGGSIVLVISETSYTQMKETSLEEPPPPPPPPPLDPEEVKALQTKKELKKLKKTARRLEQTSEIQGKIIKAYVRKTEKMNQDLDKIILQLEEEQKMSPPGRISSGQLRP